MTNNKVNETAVQADLRIDEDANQATIKELQAQVALLTQMITSQSKPDKEAENAFFKQKTLNFTVTTFKEPDKKPDVKEVVVKNG
jgi:hypothetical protein